MPRGCYFIFKPIEAITCMCTYWSIFSSLGCYVEYYMSLDTGCMFGESWLAIKDL